MASYRQAYGPPDPRAYSQGNDETEAFLNALRRNAEVTAVGGPGAKVAQSTSRYVPGSLEEIQKAMAGGAPPQATGWQNPAMQASPFAGLPGQPSVRQSGNTTIGEFPATPTDNPFLKALSNIKPLGSVRDAEVAMGPSPVSWTMQYTNPVEYARSLQERQGKAADLFRESQGQGVAGATAGLTGMQGLGRLNLDSLIQSGTLANEQAKEKRFLDEQTYKQDPARLREALILSQAQGAQAADTEKIRTLIDLSKTGSNAPGPGQTPLVPGENPPALWESIAPTLERYSGRTKDAKGNYAGKPTVGVGEFLWKMDQANPGFLRTNYPAVEAYIKNTFGSEAFNRAAKGLNQYGQMPFGEHGALDYVATGGAPVGIGAGGAKAAYGARGAVTTAAPVAGLAAKGLPVGKVVAGGAGRRLPLIGELATLASLSPRIGAFLRQKTSGFSEEELGRTALSKLIEEAQSDRAKAGGR